METDSTMPAVDVQQTNASTAAKKDNKVSTYLIVAFLVLLVALLGLVLAYLSTSDSGESNLDNSVNFSSSSDQTGQATSANSSGGGLYTVDTNPENTTVASTNSFTLESSVERPQIGQTFTVNVRSQIGATNATDTVASVQFKVDPSVFKIVGIKGGEVDISVGDQIDEVAGTAALDVALANSKTFTNGQLVAELELEVLGPIPAGSTVSMTQESVLGYPNSLDASGYPSLSF